MAFQIIIDVNDQGNLKVLSPDKMNPVMLLGFLSFASASVNEQMIRPQPLPHMIQPATPVDLAQLKKLNGSN